MSAKRLAELAFKIWGVVMVVGALASLPVGLLVSLGNDGMNGFPRAAVAATVISIVMQTVAGIVLAVWADRIAGLIESDDTIIQISTSVEDLQVLGFAIVGVIVLVSGLQNLASALYAGLTRPDFPPSGVAISMWTQQPDAVVRAAVQIVAGIVLLSGRTIIARAWRKLRAAPAVDGDTEADDFGEDDSL